MEARNKKTLFTGNALTLVQNMVIAIRMNHAEGTIVEMICNIGAGGWI